MSENLPTKLSTNKIGPIVLAVLGVLYGVSPVDAVPDVIPVAGWMDDLVFTGGAMLNLMQAFTKDSNRFFATVLGSLKWIIWIGGGIIVLLILLVGINIYNLLK